MTKNPDSQLLPLREKVLPQTSLRFFLGLIGISAAIMVVFRLALVAEVLWAKIVALLFVMATTSFAVYVILFFFAGLFSASTKPVRSALAQNSDSQNPSDTQFGAGGES